eukprot:NODE_116_length_18347_cov_2.280962.p1 type:complete len:922 gc:universal NODE_116_length_18347_cov_2.280962:11434-14199(+)
MTSAHLMRSKLGQLNKIVPSKDQTNCTILMIIAPVTCIKCDEDIVYCGVGSYILKYNLHTTQKNYIRIFNHQRIHNIIIYNNNVLINGGRIVCLTDINFKKTIYFEKDSEWFMDISLRNNEICLLTSNSLSIELDSKLNITSQYKCKSDLSFYSCLIDNNRNRNIGANVFGELTIWDKNGVLEFFKLHNGFIIKMKLIDGYLLTCSEDRTAKLTNLETKISVIFSVEKGRVWNACANSHHLFCVSEDAGVHVFDLEFPREKEVVKAPIVVLNGHDPKHLWSIDNLPKHKILLTGGNDGGLVQWPLEFKSSFVETRDELKSSSPNYLPLEHARSVHAVGNSKFICITNIGRIFEVFQNQWALLANLSFSKSYFQSFQISNFIIFGDLAGNIVIWDWKNRIVKLKEAQFTQKIVSIEALFLEENMAIAIQLVDSTVACVKFDSEFKIEWSKHLSLLTNFTSFTADQRHFIFGTREGFIHVFDKDLNYLRKYNAHHGDRVSDLRFESKILQTCGRNGCVTFWKHNGLDFDLIMESKVTKGWTEKIINKDLLVTFFKKSMKIYSISEGRETVSVECGGVHRSYSVSSNKDNVDFGFLQGTQLYTFKHFYSQQFKQISPSLFGRELRDCIWSRDILICAGENGYLKGFKFIDNSWQNICNLKASETVIKSISLYNDILFSCGGKETITAWKISSESSSLSIAHLADCPQSSSIEEVRCMSIDYNLFEDKIVLVVGYSDGYIRYFTFDDALKRFSQICEIYIDSCIFSLYFINRFTLDCLCSTSKGELALVSLTNNIFKSPAQFSKNRFVKSNRYDYKYKTKVMATGIHDFLIDGNIVYCVGDDGYVATCDLKIDCKITQEWFVSNSPLTTICKLNDSIYVSGLDQNIYALHSNGFELYKRTCISDISKIVPHYGKILVAGFGIEFY